ncbi:TPA: phage tailspike protein [Yersinia enterocolitica]
MPDIIPNVVVSMPSQLFTMPRKFGAVFNGKIYIGLIDTDPTIPSNQIQVYLENEDGSLVPMAQPIIINAGGYPVYNGQIAKFVTVEGHSMAVYDALNVQQFYFPNVLKYDPDQLRQQLGQNSGSPIVNDAMVAVKSTLPLSIGRSQHDKNEESLSVKDFGAKGDGITDDSSAFVNACISGRTIIIPPGNFLISPTATLSGDILVDGNIIISQNCSISGNVFVRGGKLTINTGATLSILGGFEGQANKIFYGLGVVTGIQQSYVEWFGALGDGITDDSVAFNSAIQATVGIVNINKKTPGYLISQSLNINKPVKVQGINRPLIKPSSSNLFEISSSDVFIDGLRIDSASGSRTHIAHLKTATSTIERIYINDIYATNCGRVVYDDNHATNIIVSLYVTNIQSRLCRERGVYLRDAFAFIFFKNIMLDYVSVTDGITNDPIVYISGNEGLFMDDVDILGGTITGFGLRSGFYIENSSAVYLTRCFADTLGGYGFRLNNITFARLNMITASLCDQHAILFVGNCTDVQGSNIYAGGRVGLTPATASINGVYISDSCFNVNLSNITTKSCTGNGVLTDGTSGVMITGLVSHNNTLRGAYIGGTSSIICGAKLTANTLGNYNLANNTSHITSAQLNSGALVVNATGPTFA